MDAANLLPQLPLGKTWIRASEGESGDAVFRRSDGAAFAKVSFGEGAGQLDEERLRTEWLAPFGLGSAAVLDWHASSDGACLVTRVVAGVPASDLTAVELLQAWPSIAERVRALHEIPVGDCPFARSLSAMFDRATDVIARNAVNPDFLDPEHQAIPPSVLLDRLRAELPQRLKQEADDFVVCHGDACLPNFMVDPETLRCTGLIDLGRLGTADRYVDFSLLLANARETWTDAGQPLAARRSLFEVHGIATPDDERLAFYLHLDPLTWG
ncbi:APH(3'') family aminoglycoside O-phosphotransferase [Variovorax sp. ZS18.2.2]|uniref:APH(3'') family aminoglycoside O-phosphotransferase n=1 Tax=Variovorax sp. ZS18.2.2 TaxID=2971255 RepID=UPI0021519405|nr:APH(3'') family aminoglycoside O-phosphotransferase [Variovorax sp. ZS18.2.2]MCR6480474.1 APH(3'') family aminoglycoside O-phosphotransferase [Variovorax sp. ZS18.2.2]